MALQHSNYIFHNLSGGPTKINAYICSISMWMWVNTNQKFQLLLLCFFLLVLVKLEDACLVEVLIELWSCKSNTIHESESWVRWRDIQVSGNVICPFIFEFDTHILPSDHNHVIHLANPIIPNHPIRAIPPGGSSLGKRPPIRFLNGQVSPGQELSSTNPGKLT